MKRKEKGRREEREKRRKFDPIHNYDQKGDVAKTTQLHHTICVVLSVDIRDL